VAVTKAKTDEIVKATGVDVAELANYKSQAVQLVDFLTHAPCKTPEQEAYFSARLSDVRALVKKLDDERTSRTKPILAAKRSVDSLFTPCIDPLKECETIIRAKLAAAAQGRFEQEQEAMRIAEEAASTGDDLGVMTALAAVPDVVQTSGSSVSFEWVADVVDFRQLSDTYKMVDVAKLAGVGRAAKAAGTEPNVPGVKWTKQAKVRAK
jgi:hypothetical protein